MIICDKTDVDFHKTFTSIFSAYTTSIENYFVNKVTKWLGII